MKRKFDTREHNKKQKKMLQNEEKKNIIWQLLWQKRTILLLSGLLGVVLLEIAKRSSFFAEEIFAKRIFKVLSIGISLVTGWIPFSLAEVSVLLCPIAVFVLLGVFVQTLRKKKEERFFLCLNGFYSVACIASLVFCIYAVGCG